MSLRGSTKSPDGERRYTVLLVQEGGRGGVWQRSIALRTVRVWLGGALATLGLLLASSIVQVATASRVLDHDTLVGENLALRARLDAMERRMAEIEPMIDRVKGYDEQLRDLSVKQALPGFGGLDGEEWEARQAWIAGVVPELDEDPARVGAGIEVRSAQLEARLSQLATMAGSIGFEELDRNLVRLAGVVDVLPQLWPVHGVLTSPFGFRLSPFGRREWKFHGGIDLGVPYGTPIQSTNDGLVSFAGWDSGHGLMVEVDHGGGVASRYCHASTIYVTAGDTVYMGDVIALVGSTGLSTGPHLHYELLMNGEKVDPVSYLP